MRNVALVLFCAIASGLAQGPQPVPTPSIVYAVHDPDAIRDYKTKPRVVREMVNRLVLAATGQPDVAKAWATLVSPDDKIGIKISAAGGELFTTHHDVVNAIVDGSSRQDIRATASSFGTVRLVESKTLVTDQGSTAISSKRSRRVTGMIRKRPFRHR